VGTNASGKSNLRDALRFLHGAWVAARRGWCVVREALASIRFLDLPPEAMRLPSLPGQPILGDRGESLSSVLKAICESETKKRDLIAWMRQLTPVDVTGLETGLHPTRSSLLSEFIEGQTRDARR